MAIGFIGFYVPWRDKYDIPGSFDPETVGDLLSRAKEKTGSAQCTRFYIALLYKAHVVSCYIIKE